MRATPERYFNMDEKQVSPVYIPQFTPYQTEPNQPNLILPIVIIGIVAGIALGIGIALLSRR